MSDSTTEEGWAGEGVKVWERAGRAVSESSRGGREVSEEGWGRAEWLMVSSAVDSSDSDCWIDACFCTAGGTAVCVIGTISCGTC